jgi:hypothetical protein
VVVVYLADHFFGHDCQIGNKQGRRNAIRNDCRNPSQCSVFRSRSQREWRDIGIPSGRMTTTIANAAAPRTMLSTRWSTPARIEPAPETSSDSAAVCQ